VRKILIVGLLLIGWSVQAQQGPKTIQDSVKKAPFTKVEIFNQKLELVFQFVPFPTFSYSQETGHVFGLVKYNLANLMKGDTVSTASSFTELASVSTEGMVKLVLRGTVYLFQNRLIIRGRTNIIAFPETVYGIGNHLGEELEEQVETVSHGFSNSFFYAVNPTRTVYAGLNQSYKNYVVTELDSSAYIFTNGVPGYAGGRVSGLGLSFLLDTRDNRYYSSTGVYLEAHYSSFNKSFGSNYNFYSVGFDLRKFVEPWKNHVLAFQLHADTHVGRVPFYSMNEMGGSDRMRGYYAGQIRDKTIAEAQMEYRIHIWKMIGAAAFVGAGQVAPNFSDMKFSKLWYCGGAGLRIMVDSKNKANLRLDYGFGQDGSSAFVVAFTEAF
jgi:hypothetical protein